MPPEAANRTKPKVPHFQGFSHGLAVAICALQDDECGTEEFLIQSPLHIGRRHAGYLGRQLITNAAGIGLGHQHIKGAVHHIEVALLREKNAGKTIATVIGGVAQIKRGAVGPGVAQRAETLRTG